MRATTQSIEAAPRSKSLLKRVFSKGYLGHARGKGTNSDGKKQKRKQKKRKKNALSLKLSESLCEHNLKETKRKEELQSLYIQYKSLKKYNQSYHAVPPQLLRTLSVKSSLAVLMGNEKLQNLDQKRL